MTIDAGSELRTAELVASLSLATDLGMGQLMEQAQRTCLLGLRLADDLGLDEAEQGVVYYVCRNAMFEAFPDLQGRDDRKADAGDGRFYNQRAYYDQLGMMQQLGLMPEGAAAS